VVFLFFYSILRVIKKKENNYPINQFFILKKMHHFYTYQIQYNTHTIVFFVPNEIPKQKAIVIVFCVLAYDIPTIL